MNRQGNVALIVVVIITVAIALFLTVPVGGKIGLLREATISLIFRTPPRFISVEMNINGKTEVIGAGETLKIKGDETIIITKVNANTFAKQYLTADIPGFGEESDLNEPVYAEEIRNQLISAGIRSLPIEIYYIEQKIASLPLEINLNEGDYESRIQAAGSADEKIALLKTAHKSFPENQKFLDQLDELLQQKGDYEALVTIYRHMIETDPDNMGAHGKLSRYYIKMGLMEDALQACRYIDDKGHATANTYRRMAFISGQLGMAAERITYLKRALELEPGNESVILDLGSTYEQTGQADKAIALYREAAGQATNVEILVPVIEDYIKRKQYNEAEKILKRYISVYPNDAKAYAQLAGVADSQGDTKGKIKYYEKATQLSPKDLTLLGNLAVAYEKAGQKSSTLKTYQRILTVNPQDKAIRAKAASLALELKQYKTAYAYYGILLESSSKTAYIQGQISAASGMKDNDRIIRSCNLYLKQKNDYDVLIKLGQAHESRAAKRSGQAKLEDIDAAIDAYKRALKLKPSSSKAEEKIMNLGIARIKVKKSLQQ